MMDMKKKARYSSPCVTGTGTMLPDLLCASVRMNVRVKALENINADDNNEEPMYFEF